MSGIPLQSGIIYGPILSRRLGRSLGINLLPLNCKVCSFDCVYCQYGRTSSLTSIASRPQLPTVSEIILAVEGALKKPQTIDYLTFAGNGEPTIHPDFPDVVSAVKEIKDRLRPDAKLAILSNSSRVIDPSIISALMMMDTPMMKLDAGDEKTFNAINRPVSAVKFSDILTGLMSLPNLLIQSMLIEGDVTNVEGEAYEALTKAYQMIFPNNIHIYSIDRPTAEGNVRPVTSAKLLYIERDLQKRFNLEVEAFW